MEEEDLPGAPEPDPRVETLRQIEHQLEEVRRLLAVEPRANSLIKTITKLREAIRPGGVGMVNVLAEIHARGFSQAEDLQRAVDLAQSGAPVAEYVRILQAQSSSAPGQLKKAVEQLGERLRLGIDPAAVTSGGEFAFDAFRTHAGTLPTLPKEPGLSDVRAFVARFTQAITDATRDLLGSNLPVDEKRTGKLVLAFMVMLVVEFTVSMLSDIARREWFGTEELVVSRSARIYPSPGVEADQLGRLEPGQVVEEMERWGTWVRIRAEVDGRAGIIEGWVYEGRVRPPGR